MWALLGVLVVLTLSPQLELEFLGLDTMIKALFGCPTPGSIMLGTHVKSTNKNSVVVLGRRIGCP